MNHPLAACLLAALWLTPCVHGQWSSDPATNVSIADGAGDQVQPKVVPTADGGCYISWFDGIGTGFDVRLQRLDANGVEQWPHNGILVADRGFSSTQDYGLEVDVVGAALLTFRDDRFTGVQITAQRVLSSGTLLWGTNGIQVTNTTGFLGPPKIAGTASGDAVVAWSDNGLARMMRLQPNGATAWPAPVDMTPPAGLYTISDLHGAGDDVIVSLVHQIGPQIFNPKHLLTQKVDATGALLWGAQPLAVFDGGSLQIGNFPSFVPDGSGGAVFAWYGVSPLQVYAQHILPNGTEAFPHNGSAGSNDLTNTRVSPSVAYDPAGPSTYLYWTEQDAGQSQAGVSGQRFDAAGAAQWGPTGSELVPVGATSVRSVRVETNGGGAYVAWIDSPSFGNDTVEYALVDGNGDEFVGPVSLASTTSGKSRLTSARSTGGELITAWTDDRIDAGDVLGQNVRPDGGLGGLAPWIPYCFGNGCPCGNDALNAGCVNSTGVGARLDAFGGPSVAQDNFLPLLSGAPAARPALLFFGNAVAGGGAGVPFGDGRRCVAGMIQRVSVAVTDGSGSAQWSAGMASTYGWSAGDQFFLQVWYRDPVVGPCGQGFNLSNGIELTLIP